MEISNFMFDDPRFKKNDEKKDEPMETAPCGEYTIFTGGAEGTDFLAEKCAINAGMKVDIKIPEGHPRSSSITPLWSEILVKADSVIFAAMKSLGKSLDLGSLNRTYTANLIRRNYFIVKDCDAVYAFGQFKDPIHPTTLKGGTGWAVQITIEMKKINQPLRGWCQPEVLVYDMYWKAWWQLHKPNEEPPKDSPIFPYVWKRIYGVKPRLAKLSAVVGSREITEDTRQEIAALFQKTVAMEEIHRYQVKQLTKKMEACHISPLASHPNQSEADKTSV